MKDQVVAVRDLFLDQQSKTIALLEKLDGTKRFTQEEIDGVAGGFSRPSVLESGRRLEKAAVQFTHTVGTELPPAASERNPHLAGNPFSASSISVIVHPRNPHVPTTHLNLRYFHVQAENPIWYFGGGFDLTPFIPYEDDAIFWHQCALAACGNRERYLDLRQRCDEYFYLPHRNEPRGVGGLFFDDWVEGGFNSSFDFVERVGKHFLLGYEAIFKTREAIDWTSSEEDWMLIRRGRYAEFNLVYDRGTKYGLQSGRRIESVLASLPPRVKWVYHAHATETLTHASRLAAFLESRAWLTNVDNFGENSR